MEAPFSIKTVRKAGVIKNNRNLNSPTFKKPFLLLPLQIVKLYKIILFSARTKTRIFRSGTI
jgi:hypothetical protein